MKPVLYLPTETQFNTQGIGTLSDAISCVVTEERNGIFELQMVYGVDGIHYEDIKHSYIILAKPNEGMQTQPFRIYRITKPLKGRITVYAEHISYQMAHIPLKPFTAQSIAGALNLFPTNAVENCPFTFWTDKSSTAKFEIKEPKTMRGALGGEDGSILNTYGGEFMFDRYLVRVYNNRGADRGVTLRYGKNIMDLTQEENITNTITGIMPYWKDSEGSTVLMLDDYVVYADNANLYPYKRVKPIDFSSEFEGQPSKQELREAAEDYIEKNGIGIPAVSLKVSLVSLWQTEEYKDMISIERINLCDTVTVEYPSLKVSAKAKVIKTVYNVLLERYTSIEIGETKSNFAQTLRTVQSNINLNLANNYATKSLLEMSVERATGLITGGLGGHVIKVLDDDKKPQELVVLGDTADIATAQEVWRWNRNGLGYSGTGYNGDYRTAITKDGHIVADFIDTGTLTANVVKAGVLSDVAGKNFWDMDTGEFQLASTLSIKDGNTTKTFGQAVNGSLSQSGVFDALTNNGEVQGLFMQNGQLYMNASYINTGSLNASLITTGSLSANLITSGHLSADRIEGGTLKLGNSSTDGVIDIYNGNTRVGHWDGNSFALGGLTYNATDSLYEGNTTIYSNGDVKVKSLTAQNYIYMNARTADSYFKMPCGDQTGSAKGYLEISGDGIMAYQNGMYTRLASVNFPRNNQQLSDGEYAYTGLKITNSSYSVTLTRNGMYATQNAYYGVFIDSINGVRLKNNNTSSDWNFEVSPAGNLKFKGTLQAYNTQYGWLSAVANQTVEFTVGTYIYRLWFIRGILVSYSKQYDPDAVVID